MALIDYRCVGIAYHSICLLTTIVLISWCIYLYSLNEDVSRVDYHLFHDKSKHIYPSVSLCFGNVFKEDILKTYGLSQNLYDLFLKGEYFFEPMLSVNYKNVTIDPEEFLLGIEFSQGLVSGGKIQNHTYWYDNTDRKQSKLWKPHTI